MIGVKPRLAIVDADFAGNNVSGAIAMMCNRRQKGCAKGDASWTDEVCQTCDEIFRARTLGSDRL